MPFLLRENWILLSSDIFPFHNNYTHFHTFYHILSIKILKVNLKCMMYYVLLCKARQKIGFNQNLINNINAIKCLNNENLDHQDLIFKIFPSKGCPVQWSWFYWKYFLLHFIFLGEEIFMIGWPFYGILLYPSLHLQVFNSNNPHWIQVILYGFSTWIPPFSFFFFHFFFVFFIIFPSFFLLSKPPFSIFCLKQF